jgi:cellulose synthase/poly-beta-1,6-N-acetylglucosamine synthase-like glycosyltransferase
VVPLRDEAATLGAFLDSLAAQHVPPEEIVICDGGSSDGSVAIIRARQTSMPRLRLVSDGDAYPGRARNLAIAAAAGDWVALTDAGTVVPPTWLEALVKSRDAHPGVDIVFGGYEPMLEGVWVQEAASLVCIAPRRRSACGSGYLRAPSAASMLIRKSAWAAAGGFPEDLRAAEDLVFFERLSARTPVTADAPDAVVHWRMPASVRSLVARYRTFSRYTLRAGLWREWHRPVFAMYLCGAVLVALGTLHSPWWFTGLPVALAARATRTIRARRPPFGDAGPVTARRLASASAMTLVVDGAMWFGLIDYLRKDLGR